MDKTATKYKCVFPSFTLDHRPINVSFISCSSDNTAWVNDGIVFSCSSVSSPSPATYVIYHNGKIIKKNKSGYHKICNVKPHHTGTYTCEPRNDFGVGESRSIHLTVYGEYGYRLCVIFTWKIIKTALAHKSK